KAPEYMVSGTPIIVFAPEVTAIVKDAQKNKWAKVITENDIEKLSMAIRDIFKNELERKEIAKSAINIAEYKFNAETVRNRFKELLSSMVE
ncbi:MAG: hypothetical protein WCG67_09810, partial [Ferruginibacter sp.]